MGKLDLSHACCVGVTSVRVAHKSEHTFFEVFLSGHQSDCQCLDIILHWEMSACTAPHVCACGTLRGHVGSLVLQVSNAHAVARPWQLAPHRGASQACPDRHRSNSKGACNVQCTGLRKQLDARYCGGRTEQLK